MTSLCSASETGGSQSSVGTSIAVKQAASIGRSMGKPAVISMTRAMPVAARRR
jgi:hypothetical protein